MKPDNKPIVTREKKLFSSIFFTLTATVLSGFATYLSNSISPYIQVTYLAHTLFGVLFSILFAAYIKHHFTRSVSTRRITLIFTGIIALLTTLALAATGLHISVFGQTEAKRWMIELHITASYFSLSLIAIHIAYFEISNRLHFSSGKYAPAISKVLFYSTLKNSAFTAIVIFLIAATYTATTMESVNNAKITPYEMPYGDSPFSPSQSSTDSMHFINPVHSGRSDKCGTCHADITNQWRSSMHAQAGSDKSYQTNVNLLAKKKSISATRYCEGCHAPVALLGGQLTEGGSLNTKWHMEEGVSCMGCHGITKINNLKGNAGYHFQESDKYLYSDSDNRLLTKIHNYLIKIQPNDHRKKMGRTISRQSELCSTCHTQFMDKDVNQWGWVKMQDEYNAWLKSPYSGQSKHTFSKQETQRCQDCHFPRVKSNDPSADQNGMVRSHTTPGANTAIPWFTGDKNQLSLVTDFLQNDKLRVTIREPNRKSAMRSQQPINPDITPDINQPGYFYLNESASISVIVTNSNIGHNFPGGTTDINEAWIHFRVSDAQDNTVFESGAISDNGDVDKNAYFYRTIAIDRHGNEVWKHDLFNMTGDSYNKFIPAGQSDISTYTFEVPTWAKSPLHATAVVRYRKFNNRYARWVLEDSTIELPIVDMARHSLTIPIRIKPEVSSIEPG